MTDEENDRAVPSAKEIEALRAEIEELRGRVEDARREGAMLALREAGYEECLGREYAGEWLQRADYEHCAINLDYVLSRLVVCASGQERSDD